MGSFLVPGRDIQKANRDRRCGIDQVPEDMSGPGPLVAAADLGSEQTVQAAGHQGQLQVQIDLHRHGR